MVYFAKPLLRHSVPAATCCRKGIRPLFKAKVAFVHAAEHSLARSAQVAEEEQLFPEADATALHLALRPKVPKLCTISVTQTDLTLNEL